MPRCNDPIMVRSLASAALLALVVACSLGNGGNSAQAPIQGEAHDPSEPAPPTAADARSLLDRRFAAQPACGAFFAMPWDVSTDGARDRRRATGRLGYRFPDRQRRPDSPRCALATGLLRKFR